MKLTRVTILGMGNVDNKTYDLDHLTYLNGENGAGKTTVLSAIQLALLGYTGVSGKRSSSIFDGGSEHGQRFGHTDHGAAHLHPKWLQDPVQCHHLATGI